MKNFYLFLITIFATSLGFGQTTIWNEAGGGTAPAGWTFENNVTSNDIDRGSYWLVEDGPTNDFIITDTYDLSSYGSATFTLDVATFGSGTNNSAKIEISDDGGSTYTQVEVSNTPSSSSYIDGGTFSLNSLTSQVVIRISSNGTTGKDVRLRNLELVAIEGSPITSVEFTSASASVSEGVGTYDLEFAITNEDATNATAFDVVLTTGDNTDIDGYTTLPVSFAAGSSTNETLTITVTDDAVFEGDETLTFSIQNVTGGNNAAVDIQSTFDLTITDNDTEPALSLPYSIDATSTDPFSDNWTQYDNSGSNSWYYNSGNGAEMNAFTNGCNAEDWLITPAFDLSSTSNELLSFNLTEGFSGTNIIVQYSTDYDGTSNPNTATWSTITTITSGNSGIIEDHTGLQGVNASNVYLAFLYEDISSCSEWTLTSFSLEEGLPPNDSDSEVYEAIPQTAAATITAANATTSNDAFDALTFVIEDMGSGDAVATNVTQMRFIPGNNNTADWSNHLAGAFLWDSDLNEYLPTNTTINNNELILTFDTPISVADGTNTEFTLFTYLNTSNITDGGILQFNIAETGSGFIANTSGSEFSNNFLLGDVIGNNQTIDVDATTLSYLQQPSNLNIYDVMSPSVAIAYVDANGNVDTDYDGSGFDISLTTSGSFDGSATTTATATNGIATFNNLVFNSVESGVTITATDDTTMIAGTFDSDSFNIIAPSVVIALQDFDNTDPEWTFTNNVAFFDNGWGSGFYGIRDISTSFPINHVNMSNNILAENDMENDSDGTSGFATTTFTTIDISAFTNVTLTFDWQVDYYNANNDDARYEVFFDGVGQGDVYLHDGNGSANDSQGTETIVIPNNVNTISLNIEIRNNGQTGYSGFDNFKLEGSYDGYIYTDGSWVPTTPNNTTSASNALIADGVAVLSSDVNLNDVVVNPGAGLEVETGNTLAVNSLTLESSSTSYSSLILDGAITGPVSYKRYVNAYTNDAVNNDNDLISAPVTGQAFGSFDSANTNLLASGSVRAFAPFNNNTDVYENYDATTNAATTLDAATGYRAATTDGATLTFTFTGTVNTGDVPKDITIGTGASYAEWNLIGNPYPSYIDVEAFLTHVVSTETAGERNIDLLDALSGIYGYDGDASDGWDIITLANDAGRYLAPGQGFFVAASGNGTLIADHDIEFTAAMRTTGTSDDFIAGRNNNPLTFIELKAFTANNDYSTEFYFDADASQGLDPGYDAVIWGGSAPSFALYSHLVQDNTGLPIALQALSDTDYNNVIIPLGVNANMSEQLTFSIVENTLPASIEVYLDDTLTSTSTLLNASDYVLTPSEDLNGTGRFYLRFSNSALSITNTIFEGVSIYTHQSNKTLTIAGQLTEGTSANVYDIQGRVVASKTLASNTTLQTIDVSNLNTGVYIVKLANGNTVKTQKIILK